MSQFFLGKFISAIFLLNPNYANLDANFSDISAAYFRFNLLLISILVLFLASQFFWAEFA